MLSIKYNHFNHKQSNCSPFHEKVLTHRVEGAKTQRKFSKTNAAVSAKMRVNKELQGS